MRVEPERPRRLGAEAAAAEGGDDKAGAGRRSRTRPAAALQVATPGAEKTAAGGGEGEVGAGRRGGTRPAAA